MRFLVAVDGSQHSRRALEYAVELATAADATLTLAYAATPTVSVEGGSDPIAGFDDAEDRLLIEDADETQDRGRRILREARATAEEGGVTVETELLYGDPVDAIPEFVSGHEFDGVFVGHRGLSDRHEGLVGSVAKELVSRSPVPVTVVR